MKDYDVSTRVRAEFPWAGGGRYGGSKPSMDGLQYRGWVLVDDRGWRWASKGKQRIRICRDRGVEHTDAIREFRRRVDEHEEG